MRGETEPNVVGWKPKTMCWKMLKRSVKLGRTVLLKNRGFFTTSNLFHMGPHVMIWSLVNIKNIDWSHFKFPSEYIQTLTYDWFHYCVLKTILAVSIYLTREARVLWLLEVIRWLKLWFMYECEEWNEMLVVQLQPLEVSSVVKELRRNKNCEPVPYQDQPPRLTPSSSLCWRQTFSSLVPTQTAIHDT